MCWASCWNLCHFSSFQISCCHLQYGFRNLSCLRVLFFFFAAVPSLFALVVAPYPCSSLSQWEWEALSPLSHALRYFFMLPTPVSWARWYWEDSQHVLLGLWNVLEEEVVLCSSACHLSLMLTKQWTVNSAEPCFAELQDSLVLKIEAFPFWGKGSFLFPLVCCF